MNIINNAIQTTEKIRWRTTISLIHKHVLSYRNQRKNGNNMHLSVGLSVNQISLRTQEIQNIQQRSKIRSIHNRTKQKTATPLVPMTSLSPGMKIQGYLIIYTNLHQHFLGQVFYVFRLKWSFLNLSTSTVFVSQISVLILC